MKKEELIELNVKAHSLLSEGKFDEIRKLGMENNIGDQEIENFILGISLILDNKEDTKDEIETADIEIIYPIYKDLEEKLNIEEEELLKKISEEKKKVFVKNQLKVVIDYIKNDETLKKQAFLPYKDLSRCYKAMSNAAREYAVEGVACIADDVVFGWIKDYYAKNDKAEVEKEKKDAILNEKKLNEAKKKAEEKKKKAAKTTKKKETKVEKPKEESNEDINNVTLDDILGDIEAKEKGE